MTDRNLWCFDERHKTKLAHGMIMKRFLNIGAHWTALSTFKNTVILTTILEGGSRCRLFSRAWSSTKIPSSCVQIKQFLSFFKRSAGRLSTEMCGVYSTRRHRISPWIVYPHRGLGWGLPQRSSHFVWTLRTKTWSDFRRPGQANDDERK